MGAAVRFIHTADWHVGLRAEHIPGDKGAAVRNGRLEAVRRIASVARESEADFVLVAGDVFENHNLRRPTVQETFEALSAFGCQVFLLPGNHDPYTPDAIYRTEWWGRECPKSVRVLGTRALVDVAGATLMPCPLVERHVTDPTAHLNDAIGPKDRVRVGVAHGSIPERLLRFAQPDDAPLDNDIPADLADRARLDYLALGDWHGTIEIDPRTWYSGAPEATRFKEHDPGNILLVHIDSPRALPRVERYPVARFSWHRIERKLHSADDVSALERELEEFPNRHDALVDLHLTGALDVGLYHRVIREFLPSIGPRFHHLRRRDEELVVRLSDADIDQLPSDGWLAKVVQRLRAGIDGKSPEECQRALVELHHIHMQTPRD